MAINMVTKTSYDAPSKDILIHKEVATAISCIVGNTGVSNDANGKKIIKAGTPVGGSTSALVTRNTVLTVTNSSSTGANAQGVLLNDVDVTSGNANATLVIAGVVDSSKCPSIDSTAVTALKHIIFVNGGTY